MAARDLTAAPRRTECRWLPAGLREAWLHAYAGVWLATLVPTVLVALIGQPLTPARPGRAWADAHGAPQSPSEHRAHPLPEAHNLPIFAWPLLLGLTGAHRHPLAKRIADGLLTGCIIVNTLQVGAAFGAYGAPLLPYVPQLPVEWAGLALGASSWIIQRRRALTVPEGLRVFALIAVVLLCAATLETVAVPHR